MALMLTMSAFANSGAGDGDFTVDLRTVQVVCRNTNSVDCVKAAAELEKHLALMAGERRPSPDGFVFSVGECPAGNSPEEYKYVARVCENRICFWGDEAVHGLETGRGALFAVYEFLDKKLGVRWMFPGDDGIVFKPTTSMSVKNGEEWCYTLHMEVCYFPVYRRWRRAKRAVMPKAYRISEKDFNAKCDAVEEWYARMRFASRNRQPSGHGFKDWQRRFLKDHPDWFAYVTHPSLVRDGKPGRGVVDREQRRVHGCYSNPEVPKAIVADWVEKGAPKRFNLCLNDGKYCHCQCAACRALDATKPGETTVDYISDRVVHLYNAVLKEALKVRPDVDVMAYVYSAYRRPPRREKILYGDNMIISWVPAIGDDYMGDIAKWKAAGVKKFIIRPNYMCYSAVFPRGLERFLFDNFKNVMKEGASGVLYDGTPRPVLDLEYYMIGSLTRCPERGFEEILEEFYSQYGAAAPCAKAYFENVRNRAQRVIDQGGSYKLRIKQRLDDSELAKFAVGGHTEKDLETDLAALSFRDFHKLTPHEKRRYDKLRLRAENALLTYRFIRLCDGKDKAAFDSAAATLYDFRLKNLVMLGNEGENWFSTRNCELPVWMQTVYMKPKR